MTLRTRSLLAAAAGLGIALPLAAEEPGRQINDRPLSAVTWTSPIAQTRALASQEPAPMPARVAPGAPVPPAAVAVPAAPAFGEPVPIYQAPTPSPAELNPPQMPPYAWPTYAPYNNYSRVASPEAYPYQSWPFIGPQYPFPKVPLGWRRVQLEWQDGHWWFSKVATPHDWWRVRYW